MASSESFFWRYLKAGLWGVPAHSDDEKNYQVILQIAEKQRVSPLVAGGIMLSEKECLGEELTALLKKTIFQQVRSYQLMNLGIKELFSFLDKNEIPAVVLKGQGLSVNYLNSELRTCGDVDLYVGPEQYDEVCEAFKAYSDSPTQNSKLDDKYHVTFANEPVEIHKYTQKFFFKKWNQRYSEWEANCFYPASCDLGEVRIKVPPVNFNAFYVFHHLWEHFMTAGVGIRQFCDLAVFFHVHHGEIDEESLCAILKKMNLMKPWKSVGCVLVDYLGLSPQEYPFFDERYSRSGRFMAKRVLLEGNFGHERILFKRAPNKYLLRKIHSFFHYTCRSFLIAVCFPVQTFNHFSDKTALIFKSVFNDLLKK